MWTRSLIIASLIIILTGCQGDSEQQIKDRNDLTIQMLERIVALEAHFTPTLAPISGKHHQ